MSSRLDTSSYLRFALASGALAVPYALGTSGCGPQAVALQGGEADGAPPSSQAPSGTAVSADCVACVGRACTTPLAACLLDDACFAIHACAAGSGPSGGSGCFCEAGDRPGVDGGVRPRSAYLTLQTCEEIETCGACAGDCGAACVDASAPAPACAAGALPQDGDGGSDGGGGLLPSACDACSSARCAGELAACAPGSACDVVLACLAACGDETCAAACGDAHATGRAAAAALASCTLLDCRAACGL